MRANHLIRRILGYTALSTMIAVSAYGLWLHAHATHSRSCAPVTVVLQVPASQSEDHAVSLAAAQERDPLDCSIDAQVDIAPTPTEPPPAAQPPPAPAFGPGSCPAPDPTRDRRAGMSLAELGDISGWPEGNGQLSGVATSQTRHGVIATWDEEVIYLSGDDGKTFKRVLDGPGTVTSVAVDCRGRVFALRNRDRLGMREGTSERWRRLDFVDPRVERTSDPPDGVYKLDTMIAAGGGYVAWLGLTNPDALDGQLAISADGGDTWRYHHVDYSETDAHVRINHKGRIQMRAAWFDCMAGSQSIFTGPANGDLQERPLPDIENGAFMGADGWLYTTRAHCSTESDDRGEQTEDEDQTKVCVLGPKGDSWTPSNADGRAFANIEAASNGRHTLGVLQGRIVRLRRGKFKVLAENAPEDFDVHSVDSSGRVLGFSHGHLVRWSKRRGFRVLTGPALEFAQEQAQTQE